MTKYKPCYRPQLCLLLSIVYLHQLQSSVLYSLVGRGFQARLSSTTGINLLLTCLTFSHPQLHSTQPELIARRTNQIQGDSIRNKHDSLFGYYIHSFMAYLGSDFITDDSLHSTVSRSFEQYSKDPTAHVSGTHSITVPITTNILHPDSIT